MAGVNILNINEIKHNSKLYFLGIGGISMSAIAMILAGKGFVVSGYDRTLGEVTDKLQKNGINVYNVFDPSQLNDCDYIIYSAAFGEDHTADQIGIQFKLLGGSQNLLPIIKLVFRPDQRRTGIEKVTGQQRCKQHQRQDGTDQFMLIDPSFP